MRAMTNREITLTYVLVRSMTNLKITLTYVLVRYGTNLEITLICSSEIWDKSEDNPDISSGEI